MENNSAPAPQITPSAQSRSGLEVNEAVAENPVVLRAFRRLQASQDKGDHMSHYTKHSSHAQKHSSTW
jgi:hypothetical protein